MKPFAMTVDFSGKPIQPAIHVGLGATGAAPYVPHPMQLAGLVAIPVQRDLQLPPNSWIAIANALMISARSPFTFNGMLPG